MLQFPTETPICNLYEMIGMHCSSRNNLQPKSLIDSPLDENFKKGGSFLSNENLSMLEANWHSPPSASTSTLSSSLGLSGNEFMDLSHVEADKFNLGVDEWESFLPGSVGNDQTLFGLIAGGDEEASFGLKQGGNPNEFKADMGFEAIHQSSRIQVIPQQMQLQFGNLEGKPRNCNLHLMVNQLPNVNFLNPSLRGSQPDHPPAKRHNPGIMNPTSGSQMSRVEFVDPYQILYGQLYKAMELIFTRHFTQAQGILARLNHQLSPSDKPFQRSLFYFKEALQHVLLMPNSATSLPRRIPNPFDGMLKMRAYKAFSEASPLIQFINFTSNQALLEAVDDADRIHIIDFDVGFGAQWSSFIQELPRRKRGRPSSLKLTAFSSPSTHHAIEIRLMHESLTQFANDVGINFELEIVNFDSFDPKFYPISSFRSSDNEQVVVNLPIWSIEMHLPLLPSLLSFIKQLSPKIVISMERGCERFELPFPYHLLHALEYFEVVLDSLDAAKMDPDSSNKIERFIFQPKIESIVLGRLQSPEIMPSWRNLFASACFSPVGFSNFAEAQAECVINKTHIRGFNLEKRQDSLVLCWQNHQLMTASAWMC